MSMHPEHEQKLRAYLKKRFKEMLNEAVFNLHTDQKHTSEVSLILADQDSVESHRKVKLSLKVEDDPEPEGEEE